MERIQQLQTQISAQKTDCPANTTKSPCDVVICSAVRTPLIKSKRGLFKDTTTDSLLAPVLAEAVKRANLKPAQVNDILVGNVLQPGSGAMNSRMAMFLAEFPETTTLAAINRQCSSGLETCAVIAAKIKSGTIDIGIGAGVESMSQYDMQGGIDPEKIGEAIFEHEKARNCMMGMGETSENVATQFGICRKKQDELAVLSHAKAARAQEQGLFKDEIVPIKTSVKDKDGKTKQVTVTQDDGIRKETSIETLSKLKPAFKKDGTTTAGNSSQVTDGAAAVVLARRDVAQRLGLPILAKFVSYAVGGVPPEIMGIGPVVAIPEVLKKAGLTKDQIGIFEINEAFGSQCAYTIEKLGLDINKVNPKGGAIALGHPLGCTGSRQIATLLPELKRQKQKYGVVSMCVGTGMGAAAVIENEQL